MKNFGSKLIELIRQFRFRSIFSMIFLSMMSVCLVISFIFSWFYSNTLIQSTMKSRSDTSKAYLNTVTASTDFLFTDNLHQSQTQISSNSNLLTLLYFQNPRDNFISLTMSDFHFATSNNSLMDSIILDVPRHDLVIDSFYRNYTENSSPYQQMFQYYNENEDSFRTIAYNTKVSTLFYYNGQYIIARDFPLRSDNRLATLFVIINTHQLYRLIISNLESSSELWIYDQDNMPVFSSEKTYPSYITSDTLTKMASDQDRTLKVNGNICFYNESSITGWKYVYIMQNSLFHPTLLHTLEVLAPVLILILISALVISFFVTMLLYKPFQHLLSSIENKKLTPQSGSRNELDYLNYAFSEITDYQNELQTIVDNISDEVTDKMFSDLLTGQHISYANINEILNSIHSSFQADAVYVACVVRGNGLNSLNDAQRKKILRETGNIVAAFGKRVDAVFHVQFVDPQSIAIVLSFDVNSSPSGKKREILNLELPLITALKQTDPTAAFGKGHLYHSILDIGFSYKEAVDSLTAAPAAFLSAQLPAKPEESMDNTAAAPAFFIESDMKNRAKQVAALVSEGDKSGALSLSERVTEDVILHSDFSSQKELIRSFLSSLYTRFHEAGYLEEDLTEDVFLSAVKSDAAEQDPAALKAGALQESEHMINEGIKTVRRQQNRYILAAKKYIEAHYNESGLSLNSIADEIGVTSNYLSKLFVASLGIYFTDYLNNCRIEHSVRQLKNTDRSVNEIGAECGFNSAQNFIRVFKKHMGCTPGQYRTTEQNKGAEGNS